MPYGYYVEPGRRPIPFGPDESDEEDRPTRMVCMHGLVVCGKCCVDFSFMDELMSDEDDEDDDEMDLETEPMRWELSPEEALAKLKARMVGPTRHSNAVDDDDEDDKIPPLVYENNDYDDMPPLIYEGNDDMPPLVHDRRRGTGQVLPIEFTASVSPLELFRQKIRDLGYSIARYVHRDDNGKVLIMADGACLNNGRSNPKAGWAFVYSPGYEGHPTGIASGRLEARGPFDDPSIQSSNRAELRAVIAALRFRHWPGEGFHTIVIATDSEYVVKGATAWVKTWLRNGWKTKGNADVKNKDMWEMLLGEFERQRDKGLSIQLWHVPRRWNTVADAAAKAAAEEDDTPTGWRDCFGVLY